MLKQACAAAALVASTLVPSTTAQVQADAGTAASTRTSLADCMRTSNAPKCKWMTSESGKKCLYCKKKGSGWQRQYCEKKTSGPTTKECVTTIDPPGSKRKCTVCKDQNGKVLSTECRTEP